MKKFAVDQFYPCLQESRAVASEVQALQEIFLRLGHPSLVYAGEPQAPGGPPAQDLRSYHPNSRDILLVHHSTGSALINEVFATRSRKILVQHNVTPPRTLAGLDPALQRASESARADLVRHNAKVRAAVAHSAFGARELTETGYSRIDVIPYTLNDRLYSGAPDETVLKQHKGFGWKNVLIEGRILPGECIEDSLFVLDYLNRVIDPHWRLILVGSWQGAEAYRDRLQRLIASMRLENVVWAGPATEASLLAYFKISEALLCLSDQCSGVALLEAMRLDVPAIAYGGGAAPEVLGDAGVLFDTKDWPLIAETVALIASDFTVKETVLKGQRARTDFFSPPMAEQRWRAWLDRLD